MMQTGRFYRLFLHNSVPAQAERYVWKHLKPQQKIELCYRMEMQVYPASRSKTSPVMIQIYREPVQDSQFMHLRPVPRLFNLMHMILQFEANPGELPTSKLWKRNFEILTRKTTNWPGAVRLHTILLFGITADVKCRHPNDLLSTYLLKY